MDKKCGLCNVTSISYAQEHLSSSTVLEVLGYPVKFFSLPLRRKDQCCDETEEMFSEVFNVPVFWEDGDFGMSLNKAFTL